MRKKDFSYRSESNVKKEVKIISFQDNSFKNQELYFLISTLEEFRNKGH